MGIRTVLLTIFILQGSLASAQPTSARHIPGLFAPSADTGAASEDTVTLEQAVAIGVQNNLPLLAERFNVTIAEANEITARLRPNPVFSFEGTHLDMLGTGYDLINNAGPAEFAFRTEFVFERGNKRQNRIDVAFQSRETARLRVLDVLRSVVLDIQIAFVDTLLAKANLGLAEEILRGFSDLVTVNEARVRAGDLAQVELLRTRVAALQFQNEVRQAALRLRQARNRLQLLLGFSRPVLAFDVMGELGRTDPQVTVEAMRERAFSRRPDLLALERDLARSRAELRLQLALGKVDYTVGAEYRRQQGLAGRGNSLGFFFSAPLPVFNRNQGEIERVRREQRQIEARIRVLRASIENEIQSAYEQYVTSRRLVETFAKEMLEQAREVRRITEYSYRRGEATFIEFLDAQRAFNETMQGFNESRAEFARSLFLIDAITAKEWTQ